jgi:hypothetical protein
MARAYAEDFDVDYWLEIHNEASRSSSMCDALENVIDERRLQKKMQ